MRISDWSSDVCSSDLIVADIQGAGAIQSPWNMAGYGIHGFGFAAITIRGTRIDYGKRRVFQIGQYGLRIYRRHCSNCGWLQALHGLRTRVRGDADPIGSAAGREQGWHEL